MGFSVRTSCDPNYQGNLETLAMNKDLPKNGGLGVGGKKAGSQAPGSGESGPVNLGPGTCLFNEHLRSHVVKRLIAPFADDPPNPLLQVWETPKLGETHVSPK